MRPYVCLLGLRSLPYGGEEVEVRDVQAQRSDNLSHKQVVIEIREGGIQF